MMVAVSPLGNRKSYLFEREKMTLGYLSVIRYWFVIGNTLRQRHIEMNSGST